VLITGASGLLGGHLLACLLERKANVVAYVRDWVPQSELVRGLWLDRVRVVRGDVRDQETLERVLGEYEIKTVFHLAAQSIVPIANRGPVGTFDTNIRGTWSLLEACRRSSLIEEVVVASSDKAYGAAPVPYREDAPLMAVYPYDVSKACGDMIAQSYAKTFNVPVVVTRCGNIFGGGDLNFSRLIPGTIRSVLFNEPPIVRSDGGLVRDYFYVGDAAEAYVLLAEQLHERAALRGHAFNFSYGEPLTVLQVVEKILELMGSELEPVVQDTAKHEIEEQWLDSGKACNELNWAPKVGMDEGMVLTIARYKEMFG
jgi:CDP-glucose 4,6-dehydratase